MGPCAISQLSARTASGVGLEVTHRCCFCTGIGSHKKHLVEAPSSLGVLSH